MTGVNPDPALETWLDRHGLRDLLPRLTEHEVSVDDLLLLDVEDLREMNLPIGPRRRLIRAIAEERALAGASSRSIGEPSSKPEHFVAERRRLTILICDLVSSTEYADRMDPEAFGVMLRTYLDVCTRAIVAKNGFIASYLGDAVKAYFGYPVASEDDVLQALSAAFDLRRAVDRLTFESVARLEVRIGIASGLVVVGEFRDDRSGRLPSAFGHVPHLAARVQEQADPGEILVDGVTHRDSTGAFRFESRARRRLKGFTEPVPIWRAIGPRDLAARYEGRGSVGTLVGRVEERSDLLRIWEEVSAGRRGELLLVTGEPGIGKSRLAHELRMKVGESSTLVLQGSPYFGNTPFYPILAEFSRREGLRDSETNEARRETVRRSLSGSSDSSEAALPALCSMLSLPLTADESARLERIGPQVQRSTSGRILSDWIRLKARGQPLLVVAEDAQWYDDDTVALLTGGRLIHSDAPILVVATARADAVPASFDDEASLVLPLPALAGEAAREMAREIARHSALPTSILDIVVSRSEGVPLYVEEFTRSAIEAQAERGAQETKSQSQSPRDLEIPTSLQSSLLARLDSLGDAKPVAQVASVIGREFELDVLQAVVEIDDSLLTRALGRLEDAELVFVQPNRERPTYAFKHALLQEAARDTVLLEQRAELHARTAAALESLGKAGKTVPAELVAQHYDEAKEHLRAADQWCAAAQKAAGTWAKLEAARFFRAAIKSLRRTPENAERRRREAELELGVGDALYARFGYETEEGGAAYQRVIDLCDEIGEHDLAIRALDGLFGINFNSCHFDAATEVGVRLTRIGVRSDVLAALVIGEQFQGMSLFCQGDFIEARAHLERALDFLDRSEEVGSDYPSMAMLYLALTLHLLGDETGALESYREAEAAVRHQTDYRRCAALGNGCILFACRGESEAVAALTVELIPLARHNGFNLWLNMGSFFREWASADQGRTEEGVQSMQDLCDALGNQEIEKSCYLALLAQAYLKLHRIEEAKSCITQGLNHVERTGERYFEAELHRLMGDFHLAAGHESELASESFGRAYAVASAQSAETWRKRAQSSLSALCGGGESPGGFTGDGRGKPA